MARLVLINGAPGSGKSTLARRYADAHPLMLALDIDVVRGLLGQWLEHPSEAGIVARRLALAMAQVHLGSGHDVVVPQFLGRLDFVLELEGLARAVGAEFVEMVLLSNAAEAAARFGRRSKDSQTQAHRDAQALLQRSGGDLPQMYANLLHVVSARPSTIRLLTVDGQVDQAYRDLVAALDG